MSGEFGMFVSCRASLRFVIAEQRTSNSSMQLVNCKVRASPAVWQIELPSLIFGKNVKNTSPTVWQKT